MKYKIVELKDYENEYFRNLETLEYPCIIIKNSFDTIVAKNDDADFNEDYCIEHNIDIVNPHHDGGIIVMFKGNIAPMFFIQDEHYIIDIYEKFIEILKEKLPEHDVILDNNDILLDGYKISGRMGKMLDGKDIIYAGCFFSEYCDLEVIQSICKKEMIKVPIGLEEYGITSEALEEIILNIISDME